MTSSRAAQRNDFDQAWTDVHGLADRFLSDASISQTSNASPVHQFRVKSPLLKSAKGKDRVEDLISKLEDINEALDNQRKDNATFYNVIQSSINDMRKYRKKEIIITTIIASSVTFAGIVVNDIYNNSRETEVQKNQESNDEGVPSGASGMNSKTAVAGAKSDARPKHFPKPNISRTIGPFR
jgi:hypothetical protein